MTEYRIVDGHPDYRIGDDGSFWSKKRSGAWRRIAPSVQRNGYLQICMYEGVERYYRKVHALVLEAFRGPRQPGMECRHLDGKRQNNVPANLLWGTHKENQADQMRHGTKPIGERHHAAKVTSADVVQIRNRRAAGEKIASLGRAFGISEVMASKIARREWWKHVQ